MGKAPCCFKLTRFVGLMERLLVQVAHAPVVQELGLVRQVPLMSGRSRSR